MKHYLLALIIFFGTILCISAQNPECKTNFFPEVTLSLNISKPWLTNNLGFGVGLYNAFFNQKCCNLIVGLEYNTLFLGTIIFNEDINSEIVMNYLGIPAYFRYNMGEKVKFFIEAGAFCDFIVLVRSKNTITNPINMGNIIENGFDKPDFGISGGIGLRIPIQKYEILLKGDYKWGIRHKFPHFSSFSYHNQYFRFTVGFKANFVTKEQKL